MELIKRPIHYTQEGKSIFDQFYLDEDYNVPEQKEDVQRIIQGSAECRMEDIRPVENYVKATGKVYFRILYMTASGDPKPAVLEGKLPFEEMVYAESDGNETFFIRNMRGGKHFRDSHVKEPGIQLWHVLPEPADVSGHAGTGRDGFFDRAFQPEPF